MCLIFSRIEALLKKYTTYLLYYTLYFSAQGYIISFIMIRWNIGLHVGIPLYEKYITFTRIVLAKLRTSHSEMYEESDIIKETTDPGLHSCVYFKDIWPHMLRLADVLRIYKSLLSLFLNEHKQLNSCNKYKCLYDMIVACMVIDSRIVLFPCRIDNCSKFYISWILIQLI